MIPFRHTSFRSLIPEIFALASLSIGLHGAKAQIAQPDPAAQDSTIPALLISDIHFDPFHDPAMVHELAAAPVSKWQSILSAQPSANQRQAFAALQQGCRARGIDTPYALLHSSLKAMRSRQPDAKFMTLSGDLIAHAFSCRYAALFPRSAPGEYQAFVLKTMSFVMDELHATFPDIPIYVALGNNDTGCGDYRLDTGSDFLAQAGGIVVEGLPASERQQALKEFETGGYYSIPMARPMGGTRLIVINDLFMSTRYKTCAGKPDPAAAAGEMTWLQHQLAEARRTGQKVWVMGHIPPGIDPFSTVTQFRDICGGQAPAQFLSSDKLPDLLVEYADVVRLGIFAHTHMDEMRLLEPEGSEPQATGEDRVALKIVPSISPVDGNNPSFTVASVNPSSAELENYDVIAASNQTGIATRWTMEYDYAQTYHEAQFSPPAVTKLIHELQTDHSAKTAESEAYMRNYFVGDLSFALNLFWPEHACALDNYTAKAFSKCVCSAAK